MNTRLKSRKAKEMAEMTEMTNNEEQRIPMDNSKEPPINMEVEEVNDIPQPLSPPPPLSPVQPEISEHEDWEEDPPILCPASPSLEENRNVNASPKPNENEDTPSGSSEENGHFPPSPELGGNQAEIPQPAEKAKTSHYPTRARKPTQKYKEYKENENDELAFEDPPSPEVGDDGFFHQLDQPEKKKKREQKNEKIQQKNKSREQPQKQQPQKQQSQIWMTEKKAKQTQKQKNTQMKPQPESCKSDEHKKENAQHKKKNKQESQKRQMPLKDDKEPKAKKAKKSKKFKKEKKSAANKTDKAKKCKNTFEDPEEEYSTDFMGTSRKLTTKKRVSDQHTEENKDDLMITQKLGLNIDMPKLSLKTEKTLARKSLKEFGIDDDIIKTLTKKQLCCISNALVSNMGDRPKYQAPRRYIERSLEIDPMNLTILMPVLPKKAWVVSTSTSDAKSAPDLTKLFKLV